MIAQMSRKSDIYHRPGCPYISRIHESHIEAFDMDDHKITHFQPCKYCCNMKTMYRKIQPNLPEIFGIFNYQTEYKGTYRFLRLENSIKGIRAKYAAATRNT